MTSPLHTPSRSASADSRDGLRARGRTLLVACYELGHQPLSLASPLATLRGAEFDAVGVDTSVEDLTDTALRGARLIGISAPMHTALRLGARVAERARALNPDACILFYGLYASLNADHLLHEYADAVIGGEYEEALLALALALDTAARTGALPREAAREARIAGVRTPTHEARPVLARLPFAAPYRAEAPGLDHYARLVRGDEVVAAGYVEASRGCLHTCLHCPITPVYGGRFFVVPREVVMADIRAQVAAGARHITFGDPDFLNGPKHALALARALHSEFPDVTFDATIKVEHLLERRDLLREFAALGLAFVVTAVESLSPLVLERLAKGHTRDDVAEALRLLDAVETPMRPTLVAFTPWTTAADYLELLDFVADYALVEQVDPVQYSIRLLVPPGSALLAAPDAPQWFGPLDEQALSHQWAHPDPRMDALQREVAALVERAASANRPATETFAAVRALAYDRLDAGQPPHARPARQPLRRPIPHLTESWFC